MNTCHLGRKLNEMENEVFGEEFYRSRESKLKGPMARISLVCLKAVKRT